jgi:nucleoid DNA-binding protein
MPNLTRREIVLKVIEEHPNLTQEHIFSIVQKTLDTIVEALAELRNVERRAKKFWCFQARVMTCKTWS